MTYSQLGLARIQIDDAVKSLWMYIILETYILMLYRFYNKIPANHHGNSF